MNSSWAGGQAANGMYPAHLNQPVYNNLTNPQTFDINQYSQSLQNAGASQTGTPQPQSFPNQTFTPGSIIPAKRPHDGISGSPSQQQPPHPQASRSQTPSYPGFVNPQQPATPQFPNAPTPYQHLQQPNSNNATPSPTMSNQPFRPPGQPGQPQQQAAQQQRMNNASPSPFPQQQPGQQQQSAGQQPQQMGNFVGNQMMTPGTPQGANQMNSMQQPGQMNQFGQQQFAMNPNMAMAMPGMQNAMAAQYNNMQPGAQQAFAMKMLQQQQQQQAQQQQQLRQSGMLPPRAAGAQRSGIANLAAGMQGMNPNANGGASMTPMQAQQQQAQQKRNGFLKACQNYVAQAGQIFNPMPIVCGKPVDLYQLWSHVAAAGTSPNVDRHNGWSAIAAKMQYPPEQYPTAGDELRAAFIQQIAQYERAWLMMRKQHAQQNAAFAGQQQTPTKMVPPGGQQAQQQPSQQQTPQQQRPQPLGTPQQQQMNPYAQFQQQHPQQQQPQPPPTPQQQQQPPPNMQQMQQPPHGTPVQAHASLPPNGMATPQMMNNAAASLQHRRNSSLRKSEPMTPQPANLSGIPAATASPMSAKPSRPPTAKQESTNSIVKVEEPQSPTYHPISHETSQYGGFNLDALAPLGDAIGAMTPGIPAPDELGIVDFHALTFSLASGIHSEVRYALDVLGMLSSVNNSVIFQLSHCDDLLETLLDCAEEQVEILSNEAAEVSDALDLPSYEDVIRGATTEAGSLQDLPAFGTTLYDLDRAADRLLAVTAILRNCSCDLHKETQTLMASSIVVKWLSNTIRLVGTRNMLLRSFCNTQDFYKDAIIILSNISASANIPSRDDALHLLHFLLAFGPQPAPSYTESNGSLHFTSYSPNKHRYLPAAVDALAKLLARADPNRDFYRAIFNAPSSSLAGSDSPLDLLTRAFAMAIAILPDRTRYPSTNQSQLRTVEMRRAQTVQAMLSADILVSLAPANNSDLARAWIESEDGWAASLLNLSALLTAEQSQLLPPRGVVLPPNVASKRQSLAEDIDFYELISHRALTMLKRLAEKANKPILNNHLTNGVTTNGEVNGNTDEVKRPRWIGIPQTHNLLGALGIKGMDKEAIGLLCELHDLAMQQPV